MKVLNSNLAYRYMTAKHLKALGYKIKLMAGGGLMLYLAMMLVFTGGQRCTVYGLGHKAMVKTYVANVRIYYHGDYIRTISQPGTYQIGMAIASNYTCK